MSDQVPEPKFLKVYFDEHMNVSTKAYDRALARGLSSDFLTFLNERKIAQAIDCSRATNDQELWLLKGKLADTVELLGLFQPEP